VKSRRLSKRLSVQDAGQQPYRAFHRSDSHPKIIDNTIDTTAIYKEKIAMLYADFRSTASLAACREEMS